MFNESFKDFLIENTGQAPDKFNEAFDTAQKNNSIIYDELMRLKYMEEKGLKEVEETE